MEEEEVGLGWLFSSPDEETEVSESFKCIHNREEFDKLEDFKLDWLFSSQDEETEASESLKCIHDREEFENLEDFQAHNKEFHKRFKRKCKLCNNKFRDTKQLKTHTKKYHGTEDFRCIHDGRSFHKVNGFHMHNSDCHNKYRQVCPHSKCLNVFNGKHSLQVHLNQQHPKVNSCRSGKLQRQH